MLLLFRVLPLTVLPLEPSRRRIPKPALICPPTTFEVMTFAEISLEVMLLLDEPVTLNPPQLVFIEELRFTLFESIRLSREWFNKTP